jgi:hypothetical protein
VASAVLVAIVWSPGACLDATEVTLVVTTDLDCARARDLTISVGVDAEHADPSAQQATCATDASGHNRYGTIVMVPGPRDSIDVRVVLGVGQASALCKAPTYGKNEGLPQGVGCIVQRRRVGYVEHRNLTLPIEMSNRCLNVPCGADQTCDDGQCVTSKVDAQACAAKPSACQPPTLVSGPRVIAQTSSTIAPSGDARQQKIIYSRNTGSYWLFLYGSPGTSLTVRSSSDLTNWVDRPSLTLPIPMDADGRDLSVAYANRNGVDVVHLVMSLHSGDTREVHHRRALVTNDGAAFDPDVLVQRFTDPTNASKLTLVGPPTLCDPDGPSVTIADDGTVFDTTGWWTNAPTYDQYVTITFSARRSTTARHGPGRSDNPPVWW